MAHLELPSLLHFRTQRIEVLGDACGKKIDKKYMGRKRGDIHCNKFLLGDKHCPEVFFSCTTFFPISVNILERIYGQACKSC